MADPTPDDDVRTPRWVKMFALVFAVLAVLFVLMHLAGGGFRGHMPGATAVEP